MIYKYSTYIKVIHVVTDFVLVNLAFLLSLWIVEPNTVWSEIDTQRQLCFLVLNLFWFYCTSLEELYRNIVKRDANETIRASLTALGLFAVLTIGLRMAFTELKLANSLVSLFLILFSLLLLSWKAFFLFVRKSKRRLWIEPQKIVLVGTGPAGLDFYQYIKENPHLGYEIQGVFDDTFVSTAGAGPVLLGKIKECFGYVRQHHITEVYCALPTYQTARIKTLMQQADQQMIRLRLVPDIASIFDKNIMLEIYGHMPVLTARQEPLENAANEIAKRGFDILFSLFAIIFILSWLTPIIALAIRLESKGPIFFKQLRSGKDNKPFHCLKFRSMRVNGESDARQATRDDNRVTRVGAFLRKSSLDELPQFMNVLLGDMSVVGPRPHMLKHTEDYSMLISNYMVRHFLMPGITGWAQVNGLRGETRETESMSKRVAADIWYLEHWSLFLDLKIVLLTVWQAIRGSEKAY